jgi:spermidine/putrescine transport system substrate-binding protein
VNDALTRLELLRRAALGGAALSLPGLLAACGGDDDETTGTTTAEERQIAKSIRWSNWSYYMDVDPKTKKHPTIEEFEQRYGTNVTYTEDVDDNAGFFAKIQPLLSRGRSTGRDLIVMTDNSPYPAILIEKGWVEKLDKTAIPNRKNLQPALQHPGWDKNRDYSMPWVSGMTGIASNLKVTGKPVTDIERLLEDPKLKGKVTFLTEFADSLAPVMLANGDDPTKVTDQSFRAAFDRIKKARDSGQIRQFTGNAYTGPLARGDLSAALSWSGDVPQLLADNPNLVWNLPDAGSDIWTDNMLIPKKGDVYSASVLINWYYRPEIAARLAAAISYISPVTGAGKAILRQNPEAAKNPLIFPTDAMLKKVYTFDDSALRNPDWQEQWQALITA